MFICDECQKEYKEKPLYCDCGNDTFSKSQSENKSSITFLSGLQNYLKRRDISVFALSFFVVCLILSMLILLFFANPSLTQTNKKQTSNIKKTTVQSIPTLDSFWKENSLTIQNEINNSTTDTNINTKSSNQVKSAKKIINHVKKTNPTTQPTASSKNTKTQKTENTTKQPQKQEQVILVPQETVKKQVSQELIDYQIALRQALFAHLSIASIKGNGSCGIEFSIDNTGKLINRNFTFQSDNKSINDEVYKMLMRMPKFYPPPQSYNGKKIKLTFEFSNGNYAINFTN